MKIILLLFLTTSSYAAITPLLVRDRALKHHPTVLAALEKLTASEENVTGARGAFDTRVISDYKRQTKGDYRTTLSRTFLRKPLGTAGSKVYVGSEQISNPQGFLSPIYHTGNPTTQTGNYSVIGLQFSLWKNLFIDPERANLKDAKFNAAIAKFQKRLTELEIEKLGQIAYWEWVTAKKVTAAYEELLKNGETRNEYLTARNKKGDIAQILITENEQYIASRKRSLQASKERLLQAEYNLSLFNRDENGLPTLPNASDEFEDYPTNIAAQLENIDLKSDLSELITKRPDMKNLALNLEKTEVSLDLARQDLKPQIDVTTEYYKRTVEHPNMPLDYLMVMAQVSIPIERNLGKGNIAAARARQMVAQRELSYGYEAYKVAVMSLRQSLGLRLEQVTQSEIEFSKSKELVKSETYKFKTGGGNLFLVNLREEAQASAEASFHESRLSFMTTLLSYKALVSTTD